MTANISFRKEVVRAIGFCSRHMHVLFEVAFSGRTENGLGFAVYVRDAVVELERLVRDLHPSPGSGVRNSPRRAFIPAGLSSRGTGRGASEKFSGAVAGSAGCPICSLLLEADSRRMWTFLEMLEDDTDFAKLYRKSGGLCALHFTVAVDSLASSGTGSQPTRVLIIDVELQKLGEIRHLLDERIRKYAWEYKDENIAPEEATSQMRAMHFIAGVEGLYCKTRKTPQYADLD